MHCGLRKLHSEGVPATAHTVTLFADFSQWWAVVLLFVLGVLLLGTPTRSMGAVSPSAEADGVHTIDGTGGLSVFGVVSAGGSKADYHFEFLSEKEYEEGDWAAAISSAGPKEPAEGERQLVVEEVPAGLSAGETYRYRLTVESAAFPGDPQHSRAVRTLVVPAPEPETEPACPNAAVRTGPSARLPDCRAYEQVTPVNKESAEDIFDYGAVFGEHTVVGLDGEHLIFQGTTAKWRQNVGGSLVGQDSYSFDRTTRGWTMTSLYPQPQTGGVSLHAETGRTFDTPDLSQVLLEERLSVSNVDSSPVVGYALGPPGGPYKVVASDLTEGEGKQEEHWGHWAAQSRDGSAAVIESPDHELIPGKRTGTTKNREFGNFFGYDLYEYSDGRLSQVNIYTGGETIGTCGAELVQGREGGGNRGQGQATETSGVSFETGSINAVSSNGSRIFFEAFPAGCPSTEEETYRLKDSGPTPKVELYMRLDGEETVDIGNYIFEGANPEGTRLLLARWGRSGLEYFSYDTETRSAKPLFSLQGDTLGWKHALSEDGDVYYFEAGGSPLTPEAPAGVSAIYRYDIPSETMSFVAVSVQHEGNGNGGFYASPDGGDFYFNVNSVEGVSGGHNKTGENSDVQVYRYDSAEDVVQCISCASPFNPEPRLLSTLMPEYGPEDYILAPLASPASENGDFVFFDTPSALLPQDINGEVAPIGLSNNGSSYFSPSSDVYEWRREGVDGCGKTQGCLALITNGIDGTENVLLGVGRSGRDVFIGTHSQLAPTDTDHEGDIYDVRIDGGFPANQSQLTECEGDACSTPPSPPTDQTPASSTFSGPGDPVPPPPTAPAVQPPGKKAPRCPQRKVLRHGRCVARRAKDGSGARRSKAQRARGGRGR